LIKKTLFLPKALIYMVIIFLLTMRLFFAVWIIPITGYRIHTYRRN
jgi:hypothetical protein